MHHIRRRRANSFFPGINTEGSIVIGTRDDNNNKSIDDSDSGSDDGEYCEMCEQVNVEVAAKTVVSEPDQVEGTLPTRFRNICRNSRFLNRDRKDEAGPSTTTGASTSTTSTSQTDRANQQIPVVGQPSLVAAANVILRRSPRLSDLAQRQQSSQAPTEITLRRSSSLLGS